MPLTGAQHQQLQDALLAAFDEAALRRMVRGGLDESLEHIAGRGNLKTMVFDLVDWSDRAGRVAELIAAAYNHNTGNPELHILVRNALDWPVCQRTGLMVLDGRAYTFAPRAVEEVYLEGLVRKYNDWAEKYTPLAGVAEVETTSGFTLGLKPIFMPTGFERLVEHGFGPQRRSERVPVDDLRTAVATYRRLVVLGEPGSGKTTTLWRLMYDYAVAAMSDANAPLPLLALLDEYSGPEEALQFVAPFFSDLAMYLPAYLARNRVLLLLDALNQMPRHDYRERVARIQRLLDRFAEGAVVVTCRRIDYVETLSLDKLEVKALDIFRQREYLQRYLGEAGGDELFWQLAGGGAVTDLWAAWQKAGMTFEEFWTLPDLPLEVLSQLTYLERAAWRALRKGDLPSLLALGANPLLLRMFCQVYSWTRTLPSNRGKLFAAFVDMLVERQAQIAEIWPGADVLCSALAGLAYAMQMAGARGAAVGKDWALSPLASAACGADEALYLAASASLLDVASGQVRFVHQLIQEYFAALAWQSRLAQGDDLRAYWPEGWVEPTGWEETAVLLAGILPDMTSFVEALIDVNPALAARCIAESGGARPSDVTADAVQTKLVSIATSRTAPVKERNAAGNALNYLGDPRDGVGVKDGLPDIIWCQVPAGEFLMGSTLETDDMAGDDEAPQHRVELQAYSISRYLITNAQYQVFVADGGYTAVWKRCWTATGWQWKTEKNVVGPRRYGEPYDQPNHPVVGVTWFEAVAFCAWLGEKLGQTIHLPSEAEWEKAARGVDGRKYPWGEQLTPDHANYYATRIGTTSAVGIFTRGESVYGLLDMAGNVWEWTRSRYRSYPYKVDDGRENLEDSDRRTLRGGSFLLNDFYADVVRCANRVWDVPVYGSYIYGIRVMCPGS